MSRAQELATQLESLHAEAVRAIEACDAAAWQRTSAAEGWTAAALAWHFSDGFTPISDLVQGIANGADLPAMTEEMFNAQNAKDAVQFASVDRQEVLDALRRNGARAIASLRDLRDEQLQRSARLLGGETTAEQAARRILIGHLQGHLESFKATTAGERAP